MKKYAKETALVNKLISVSENIPQRTTSEDIGSYFSFGVGESNISFRGAENSQLFSETIRILYKKDKEILGTCDIDEFQSSLIKMLRQLRNSGVECNEENIESLYNYFLSSPMLDQEIFFPIHGISITNPTFQLGDFCIYKISESLKIIKEKYPSLLRDGSYEQFTSSAYWISLKVSARTEKKALELSLSLFETFEHLVNYMRLELQDGSALRIFKPITQDSIKYIVCNKDTMGYGTSYALSNETNLEEPLFQHSGFGNDKIWKFATQKNKTDLEERIIAAIEWIGKGVVESDNAKSLVQFVFAIEGMFQNQENTIFTPSILSNISESLAFLIGNDVHQRKEIVKSFKQVYTNRSAVAHGSSKPITKDDLKQAHELACQMVISFLVKAPFNTMTSAKEFNDYISDLKFT